MRRLRGHTFIVGVVAALTLTACGGSSNTDSGASSGTGLEKTTINIGFLPIPDVAAVFIANQKGYFKEEGLTIKTEQLQSTGFAIPKLLSGSIDISLGSYMTMLSAAGKTKDQFRYIADAYQAKADIFDIVVPKDSPIQTVQDLKGKKISTPAPGSVGDLAISNSLRIAGLDPKKDIQYLPMAFPDVIPALQKGSIDAGWLTEPFLTGSQKDFGMRKIADTMTGAMADLPIAGWSVTEAWSKKYPKTMAAFQRAYLKAQQLASTDRKVVEQILPSYTKISPDVAAIIGLGVFPTTVSATRVQRVADLMLEYGFLTEKLDVTPLLIPLPQ